MSIAWLAQSGSGGVDFIYKALLVVAGLLLVIFVLTLKHRVFDSLAGGYNLDLSVRWPKAWRCAKPPVIKHFRELYEQEREAIFAVRSEVFLNEQRITSVPDRDGVDPDCEHVLVYAGRRIVGTARLQMLSGEGVIKVGRVAVLKNYRDRGIGTKIMHRVQDELCSRGLAGVMFAQAHLEDWYARLGWRREGAVFMEAGIEHIKMHYAPDNAA